MANRNIILLTLDAVRKDIFDEWSTRIQKYSDLSYQQARAASSWSVPSHASMFSGKLPSEHGIHTYNRDMSSIPNRIQTNLPNDYHSICISSNIYASSAYGFDELFDQYIEAPRYQPYPDGLNATTYFHESDGSGLDLYLSFLRDAFSHDHSVKSLVNGGFSLAKAASIGRPIPDPVDDGAKLITRELTQLLKTSEKPVFAFANMMEAHAPMSHFHGMERCDNVPLSWSSSNIDYWDYVYNRDSHSEDIHNYRNLYKSSVAYLDKIVGDFIQDIKDIDGDTTIIITSDHGENLGYDCEENNWEHKSSLSEALLHVPFEVVNAPDNGNESAFISHLDLPEYIGAIADDRVAAIERKVVPAEIMGMSAGPEPPSDAEKWDLARRCLYVEGEKYEWSENGRCQLINLDARQPSWQSITNRDVSVPKEKEEIFEENIQSAAKMAAQDSGEINVDDATAARLADLGYL
ncbi:sulfatase-like hydrolase/transferase (plasmid) [Haladaptatus sp. SPP-AMP-3]|uniref:sulfatase-like hydrolase/transferase n=1 Tax=Haladaptatus sp. SPP-AMP-3 TaxID=3121295 RepID=UPI003C2FE211